MRSIIPQAYFIHRLHCHPNNVIQKNVDEEYEQLGWVIRPYIKSSINCHDYQVHTITCVLMAGDSVSINPSIISIPIHVS